MMASTGPSQTIPVVYFSKRWLYLCQIEAKTPGVHSSETGALIPYIWESMNAFGFITTTRWVFPVSVRQVVRKVMISARPA